MIDEYKLNKPRTLRCTGAEMDFLKKTLIEYRAGRILDTARLSTDKAKDEPSEISRVGISPEDFLKSKGLDVPDDFGKDVSGETPDYTEWQSDPKMIEIDRGCVYEIDSLGYPEEAERFARLHPQLWQKMFATKRDKKTQLYNEIMFNEVWEIVKNGKF